MENEFPLCELEGKCVKIFYIQMRIPNNPFAVGVLMICKVSLHCKENCI